uniref:V-type ATP synthase subunit C n=1 Tax=Candidatus Methanophagaceae archaeon ANME-1 ERB6 TaxID=2759912 RepID=A0A7G9YZC4_9EURY|nr:V-type ATP synthase subunit C [Methanosarcinales archaeon ANME-1 ERB6]
MIIKRGEIEAMTVSKYAYVYARIRARMCELMDERRLRELVDTRSEDFLSSLMDTTAAYKDKLTKAALVGVEAREIEITLKEDLIDQYLMVIKSTEGAIRDVFVEFLRRLEVKNLKAVIRAKAAEVHGTGTSTAEAPMFFPVEDFFKRRISRLTEADSIENVIKQSESPYKRVLEDALPEYEKSKRVLVLENVLDEEISGAIREKVERLSGADKEIARKIVGTEFDLMNLMILLRCKSEGIAEAEIRKYLLPDGFSFDFNLDVGAMNDSISAENVSSAVQLMPASAYKEVLTGALSSYEAEKSLAPLENALSQYFFVTVKSILRGYPLNIGTIIGFLYLKEIEIRNLCTIAVCKENEIPVEETMKMVML